MSEAKGPIRVLFLCAANACRSQMAEAFLRAAAPGRVEVASAGIAPASEVHPLAARVMAEYGLDLSSHRPKHVREVAGERFDLVVTTCDAVLEACPVLAGGAETLHWSLEDPAAAEGPEAERLGIFRRTAAEIRARIEKEILPRLAAR